MQPGVGRESDGVGLDGSVDIDGIKRGGRDGLGCQASVDGQLEHDSQPSLPMRLRKRVNWVE